MDLKKLLEKAKTSGWYLKLLNIGLNRMIPFNRPHGFRVISLSDDKIKTYLPYKRKNLNHIRGLHACALATLCEFTTGLFLISKVGFDRYRIILKNLQVDYQYQGKTDAFTEFVLTKEQLEEAIYQPLKSQESVTIDCPIEIKDANQNLICQAVVQWQLKEWSKVRTKV